MKQTTETPHPTQRNASLDFLRILACFMVVVMHAQPSTSQGSSLWLSFSSYATVPCIGLFFMISGALRLSRPITDCRNYLKGIFRRIVVPVVWWNVVFGVVETLQKGASWSDLTTYQFLLRLNNPSPSWCSICSLRSCSRGCKPIVVRNNVAILCCGCAPSACLG